MLHCTLLYMPEAMKGGLCLLVVFEVSRMMHCMLFCMLEAMEGGLYLLQVLRVPEMMRCVLLNTLEAGTQAVYARGNRSAGDVTPCAALRYRSWGVHTSLAFRGC